MDDKKEDKKPEDPAVDTGEGIQSATDEKVQQLNADTERINQAIAENENAKARQKLSGTAEAGQTPEKKEETNEEYTERFLAGGVNPMKPNAE